MNSKQFLLWGGIILLVVGILGYFLIGPTPDKSIFGATWWFDNGENIAHTVLGIVAIIASMSLAASAQKSLTIVVGVIALFFGVYNFFSTSFLGANLESPADLILHLVVAAWALWAGMQSMAVEAQK